MMRRTMGILILALFGACSHGEAFAQSDADLRRENQRLQAENEDLQRELEAARLRIAELDREIARLRRQVEAARSGEPAPEEFYDEEEALRPVSIDEDNPAASPHSLLRALMASYEQTLGDLDVGERRSPEREQYFRALRQWRDQMRRDYRRMRIEWHVHILEVAPAEGGYTMRLIVVDPQNEAQIGSPFILNLHRRMARRYEQLAARGDVGAFVLRGSMTPAIMINEARTAPGPFNNPPFIGAFAEFTHTIEPRSFLPAGEDER